MKRSVGRVSISLGVAAAALVLAPAATPLIGATLLDSRREAAPFAVSQLMPSHDAAAEAAGHSQHMMMMMDQHMMNMHGDPAARTAATPPAMPGQAAFGAIQEIVRILEADPTTDWSKVDLEGLRQHLIDMNEVTLEADAVSKPVEGGLQMEITGSGRTLAAIQRMAPNHARAINGLNGWRAETESLPNGVLLTVTASDAKEIAHIRGLGFIGILVSGSHHQLHHLAMAKGEMTHAR